MNTSVNQPSSASWFQYDLVSSLEKTTFADVLKTDIDTEKYKSIRNFIFDSFKSRPNYYLSVTHCRRYISADIYLLIRIHSFLENWGLINGNLSLGSKQFKYTSASYFDKIAKPDNPSSSYSEWTKEETSTLLDSILQFGSDWTTISATVNKSVKACIAQFMSLKNDFYPILHDQTSNYSLISFTFNPSFAISVSEKGTYDPSSLEKIKETIYACQLKKISLKLSLLQEIDNALQAERKDIEKQRLQVFVERVNLMRNKQPNLK